ncbi:MAG: efflux RND transporter periplasmic adaptor subunit [Rikenellaceae bacterium]|nr:efflux RND transporter periplasmic adaptor subunit [Rikenellaceae bacterium]
MRKIAFIIAACSAMFAGCRSANQQTEQGELGKLQHSADRNEVEVIELKRTTFTKELISNGRLTARQKSVLAFKSSGTIAEVHAANGQSVAAGTALAALDKTAAQATLSQAEMNLSKATLDLQDVLIGLGYKAADTLSVPADVMKIARIRSGYAAAVAEVERARRELAACTVTAPFAGKVAGVKQRRHEQAGGEFCTLIDDKSFVVNFNILETEYGFIKPGQTVKISTFNEPNVQVSGRVTNINPTIDDKGQVAVQAEVANNGRMIDGMNVKVIVEENVPGQLVVPKSAVVIRDNLEVLFRYNDNGSAMWTYVHTLLANTDSFVVEANISRGAELNEGDRVIVSGNLNLADGSKVVLKNAE